MDRRGPGAEGGALGRRVDLLAAQGARLDVVETPGQAWCMQCSAPVTISRRGDACPTCGSHQLQVTGGERMRVMDIEID